MEQEKKPQEKMCDNIYHPHSAHEWGVRGKIYWCNGITKENK